MFTSGFRFFNQPAAGGGSLTSISKISHADGTSPSLPSGYQDGDLIIASIGGYNSLRTGSISITSPWVSIVTDSWAAPPDSTDDSVYVGLAYQIVSGTPNTSGLSVSGTNDRYTLVLYRGNISITGVTIESTNSAASGSNPSSGSVTGASNGPTIAQLMGYVRADTSTTLSPSTGATGTISYTSTNSLKTNLWVSDTGVTTLSGCDITGHSQPSGWAGCMLTIS